MLTRSFRLDFGSLGSAERTPQGGLRVPATLTRTGVFVYHSDDGRTIREYRPADEVFRKETLASLRGSPLTVDHPPESLKPANFRQWATGHVGDDIKRDGDKTSATAYVQDQAAIRAIEAGRRQISCGYHCDVDETPGVSPDGEAYDRIQRNIVYNHVALVDNGRAGPDVRLRLDAAGNSTHGEHPMSEKIEVLGGIEYTVGTDAHRDARARADADDKALSEAVKALVKERDAARATLKDAQLRADAAKAKLAKVVEGVRQTLAPARIDAAVRARTAVLEIARREMGAEFKTDGISNREIKIAVLRKRHPELATLRQDSKDKPIDAGYLSGLWAAFKATTKPAATERKDAADARGALRAAVTPMPGAKGAVRSTEQVRLDYNDEQEQRAHRPLALSKKNRSNPMIQSSQIETMK